MQYRSGDASYTTLQQCGTTRFNRIPARDSGSPDLMHGCQVVTVDGEKIGEVDYLMVDKFTHQLRYVMLSCSHEGTTIAIPWQTLYFDSTRSELVFYTTA